MSHVTFTFVICRFSIEIECGDVEMWEVTN